MLAQLAHHLRTSLKLVSGTPELAPAQAVIVVQLLGSKSKAAPEQNLILAQQELQCCQRLQSDILLIQILLALQEI